MIKFILIVFCLISCGPFKKDNEIQDPITPNKDLIDIKLDRYIELSNDIVDKYGFPVKGDGILFACLRHYAGAEVDWKAAEKEPGRMERHPDLELFEDSATAYSKDMLVGELLCIWKDRDLEFLERRISYLEDHDWDMCGRDRAKTQEAWLTRCKVSTNLKATLYEMQYQLGGKDNVMKNIWQVWNPLSESFPTHLTMLQFYLRGVMQGAINDLQLDFMKEKSKDTPDNALYSAIYHSFKDGDMSQASASLLKENYFPNSSLPTSDNYCTHYLFQRDLIKDGKPNPDWLPCPKEKETYHGTDFIFAAYLILRNLDK